MNANTEVDNNFAYFKTQLPELKKTHLKEFVLLHKRKVVEIFESENNAIKIDNGITQ